MTPELYIAFCGACVALFLTPGPMVAFIIATTLSRSMRHGLAAIAGSLAACAIQLGVVAAGLAALLSSAGHAFFWIKWFGVAYLVYLGVKALRAPVENLGDAAPATGSLRRAATDGFVVALTNPKTLLFHGAFLPLFISPDAAPGPQLALLAVTFIALCAIVDCGWAVFAARARPFVARIGRWRNRITGGVFLTAAAGLALVRK
ncbi:MAG: LysE family translocator [Parvularculaceae bacterium]